MSRSTSDRRRAARILLLGGTGEATLIARLLVAQGEDVITSLAGLTRSPAQVAGTVRVGGFGGASGLAHFIAEQRIRLVVDATHPFAATLPWTAASVCTTMSVPRLRVLRPPWQPAVGDDLWHEVRDVCAAAATLPVGAAVFLALGGRHVAPFATRRDLRIVLRVIELGDESPLPGALVIQGRGPFTVEDEERTLRNAAVDWLVTRNSGGWATAAKLVAARRLGLPVVMIGRPPQPAGPTVGTTAEAVIWVRSTLSAPPSRSGATGAHRR